VLACLVSFFWPHTKKPNSEQTIQWPKERNQAGKHGTDNTVARRKKPNRQTLNRQYSGQKKETKQANTEQTIQWPAERNQTGKVLSVQCLPVWFLSVGHCIVCSVFACLVSFFWSLYCLFSVCLFGFFLLATAVTKRKKPSKQTPNRQYNGQKKETKQANTEQTIQWPKERNQTDKH
jgi:Flp pilus assembly protein TadB